LQTAFDVDQLALGEVLVADLCQTVPNDDTVPFGFLLTFAGSFVIQTLSVAMENRQNGVPRGVFSARDLSDGHGITLFTDFAISSLIVPAYRFGAGLARLSSRSLA
jgi:hypothetical protein